jgi:hypothetical protein
VLGGADQDFNFLDGDDDAAKANPLEGRLSTVGHLRLVDQAYRLQYVGDVVKSSDLGLEELLVKDFAVRDLLCSLFE